MWNPLIDIGQQKGADQWSSQNSRTSANPLYPYEFFRSIFCFVFGPQDHSHVLYTRFSPL